MSDLQITNFALGACVLLIVGGAASDIAARRIPNWLCLLLALCGGVFAWATGGLDVLGSGALHGVIALVIGMGLFAIGWLGGGDAKFYAACALAVPLGKAVTLLFWTAAAGLVLVLGMMAVSVLRKGTGAGLRRLMIPYGVAIALGSLATIFVS